MIKKSIILVENNPYDQEIILKNIGDHFRIMDCFDDISELVSGIKSGKILPPDLVLLDLGLNRSWGYQTFEKAMPIIENCNLIVLTGLEDQDTGKRAIANGALDYITKEDLFSDDIIERIEKSITPTSLQIHGA